MNLPDSLRFNEHVKKCAHIERTPLPTLLIQSQSREEMMVSDLLLLLFLLYILSPAISGDPQSRGCYWTESCQSKWFGGCRAGEIITDRSEDCNGLCEESSYPPCLPFHTHFHCCIPEKPKVTDRCSRCNIILDFGDEYICCSDCSNPYLIDKNTKFGYCRTGSELAVQLKPQETFKWVTGPWMKCSSPCDGGIRYRDVGCFRSTEDTSIEHYPVDDIRCSEEEMPARQEPCNLQSCTELSITDESESERHGMSGWLIMFLVLLGLVAVGGLGFVGYTFYKRRRSAPTGFVYIMLEGFS